MFAFEWEKGGPWNSRDIQGVVRWLNDVWNLVTNDKPTVSGEASEADVRALRRKADLDACSLGMRIHKEVFSRKR